MTLLVIETGFAALSVALIDGDRLIAEHHAIVGRGHAEQLMPAIAGLLAGREPPDAILVDAGPGSYTGIRVGIAAARALALAWGIEVTATTSTALVAAGAFASNPGLAAVSAILDAGRGQVYVETITADWRGGGEPRAATLVEAVTGLPCDAVLTGSGAAMVTAIDAFATVSGDHPRAADARWLPQSRREARATPLYLDQSLAAAISPDPVATALRQ